MLMDDEIIQEHRRKMPKDTKQFIIKVLVVGAVLLVLYFVFSPYRNCMRATRSVTPMRYCMERTSW